MTERSERFPASDTALMIDRAGSQDRDDALRVDRTDTGWVLTVHVANVASHVPAGTLMDRDALRRAQTRYGPTAAATKPMLPPSVERAATLSAGRDSRALTTRVILDPDGTVTGVDVHPSQRPAGTLIALDHQRATAAITDPGDELHPLMAAAHDLAQLLLRRRRDAGALALYDLARGWTLTEDGHLRRLTAEMRTAGYVVVQETMIAANAALATWCADRDIPVLFRNHVAAAVAPVQGELLADVEAALASGSAVQVEALNQRTHLLMRRATYDPTIRGHYGLALPAYTHATSPLRRYADLVTQRAVTAYLEHDEPRYTPVRLTTIAETLNAGAADRAARKSAALRTRTHAEQRRALAEGALTGLDATALHKVVKRAVEANTPTPELVDELAGRPVEARNAYLVLVAADGDAWTAPRRAMLARLTDTPELAASVLAILEQQRATEVRYDETTSGTPTVFTVRALVDVDAHTREGAARRAPAKKTARHLAALSLIAQLADLDDPTSDAPLPEPPRPAGGPRPSRAAIGYLNEAAQRGEITGLAWAIDVTGPDHQPTVTGTVTGHHATAGAMSATGTARTKADARAAAANAFTAQLSTSDDHTGEV